MTSTADIPALSTLAFYPVIQDDGTVSADFSGKVGVYAICDRAQVLQFVGYSRDVYLSLRQHLVRCPQACHWYKVTTIDRPSRTVLAAIQAAWIAENGETPPGNGPDAAKWTQPIDVKTAMTEEEQAAYAAAIDDLAREKQLKNVARRIQAEILAELEARGLTESLRFNPKLKSEGILDLK